MAWIEENTLDGSPENDPDCIEYWINVKRKIDMAGPTTKKKLIDKYAKMVECPEDEFENLSAQELVEIYKY